MYNVVEIQGHQYKVGPGDLIDVDRIESAKVGETVEFDQVLFISGETPKLGRPVVEGAKVKAKVLRQARDRKIIVLKRKPGKYRKVRGHRQSYTGLLVTEVTGADGKTVKIDKDHKLLNKANKDKE